MRHKRSWMLIGFALLIVVLLTSGVALAGPPRQGPVVTPPPNVGRGGSGGGQPSSGGAAPANAPPGEPPAGGNIQFLPFRLMSYQGKLLFDGTPYNGNIDLTFRLYTVEVSGTAIWEETQNVAVNDGLFNVMLGTVTPMADAQDFFEQLWLGIEPAGAAGELIPRQLLGAVGYAQNVLPGATMVDPGLPGYWTSFYVESHGHPAIYGSSDTDNGVTGETSFTGTNGVVGNAWGVGGAGVYGYSGSGPGVYGTTENSDSYSAAGVWGQQGGDGVGTRGNKPAGAGFGAGVYATNFGDTGSGVWGVSTNWAGVWGDSENYWAVYGDTWRGDSNYGLYTPDNLWSLNYHLAGAVMHLAQNGGSEPLEPGDVVVFSGMGAPLENGLRVVQVARAASANSTAVAGVVHSRYNIAVVTAHRQGDGRDSPTFKEVTPAGPVPPGEYLLIVVQGPAQVKVSGAVNPGDLLSSAGRAGYAARAAEVEVSGVRMALPGTVFGKALETVEAGEKTIYVFVTLQ